MEIENVIAAIDGIELVSVVGIPDPIAVDLAAAVFVRKAGFEKLTEEKIIQYVSEKLPERNRLLGGAYCVDKLPMGENGKIQFRAVQEIAARKFKRNDEKRRG